jgi:hypothetical protein
LLDRGFICAIAHVRGGGELGRYWYQDGKLLAKNHTFDDAVAAAEFLIKVPLLPAAVAVAACCCCSLLPVACCLLLLLLPAAVAAAGAGQSQHPLLLER